MRILNLRRHGFRESSTGTPVYVLEFDVTDAVEQKCDFLPTIRRIWSFLRLISKFLKIEVPVTARQLDTFLQAVVNYISTQAQNATTQTQTIASLQSQLAAAQTALASSQPTDSGTTPAFQALAVACGLPDPTATPAA